MRSYKKLRSSKVFSFHFNQSFKKKYKNKKENQANNYYLITLKYEPAIKGVDDDISLIEYSPKTTSVTTSFWGGAHTSASSNLNAGIGVSAEGPSANIGGGIGADCGINSTITCDFPPIQILTRASKHTIHWVFKIFGSEEPKTTFRVGLTSQWKFSRRLIGNYDDNSKLPFVMAIANGRFNMHIDQETQS